MKADPPDIDYDSALSGWVTRPKEPADEDDGFGTAKTDPAHLAVLDRLRDWTRQRFKLPAEAAILVSEIDCRLPGCPPRETVFAFWENDKRHHFKLFKPAAEVGFDDLPFTWMNSELIVADDFSCECC
jgi:hypothetical protein